MEIEEIKLKLSIEKALNYYGIAKEKTRINLLSLDSHLMLNTRH